MSFETVSPPTVMSEEAINRFYGSDDISARIIDALRTAGKDLDALTREDLSKFDEFHPGGAWGDSCLGGDRRLAGKAWRFLI